ASRVRAPDAAGPWGGPLGSPSAPARRWAGVPAQPTPVTRTTVPPSWLPPPFRLSDPVETPRRVIMSLFRPLSTNGCRPGLPVAAPEVGFQSASLAPETRPTGQCVTSRRGGDDAVCADASMLRSMTLRPMPPPTAVRNARRLNLYEIISFTSEWLSVECVG